MKLGFIIFFVLCIKFTFCAPPTVSVNYTPKKQWKLSKHDLADIKLDIEAELRQKILQVQMEWENRQRMEQNSISNSGTMNQPFYIPPPGGNGYDSQFSKMPGLYPRPNQIYPNWPRNPMLPNDPQYIGSNLPMPQATASYNSVNVIPRNRNMNYHKYDLDKIDENINKAVESKTTKNLRKFMDNMLETVNGLKSQVTEIKNKRARFKEESNTIDTSESKETAFIDKNQSDNTDTSLGGITSINLGEKPHLQQQLKQEDSNLNNSDKIDSRLENIINKYKIRKTLDKVELFLNITKSYNKTKARGVSMMNLKNLNDKINQYVDTYGYNMNNIVESQSKKLSEEKPKFISIGSNITSPHENSVDMNNLVQIKSLPAYNQIKSMQADQLQNKKRIGESSNLIKQLVTVGKAKRIAKKEADLNGAIPYESSQALNDDQYAYDQIFIKKQPEISEIIKNKTLTSLPSEDIEPVTVDHEGENVANEENGPIMN